MVKQLNTPNKHTPFSSQYQVLLPLNVAVLIPANDSVRLLSDFMDKLDYTLLKESYSDIGRNPSVCPITMLKILVYSYMSNIYSSRKIASAAKEGNKKRLYVSKGFQEYRKESLKNITNMAGITLRMNRSIQVEGAFGVIKQDYAFRRFLMRGQEKVKIEFLLLSIGYNVNKLHNKRRRSRDQEYLHKKEFIA